MTHSELTTYADLLKYLQGMTPEQLKQSIQVAGRQADYDKPIGCQPVYAIGTVKELFYADGEKAQEVLSSDDNQHHPEQVVLCSDFFPFSRDGDSYYELHEDGSMTGNASGKTFRPGEDDDDDL